jgi:hypothetical protein
MPLFQELHVIVFDGDGLVDEVAWYRDRQRSSKPTAAAGRLNSVPADIQVLVADHIGFDQPLIFAAMPFFDHNSAGWRLP